MNEAQKTWPRCENRYSHHGLDGPPHFSALHLPMTVSGDPKLTNGSVELWTPEWLVRVLQGTEQILPKQPGHMGMFIKEKVLQVNQHEADGALEFILGQKQ